jgi:hypothetical protein
LIGAQRSLLVMAQRWLEAPGDDYNNACEDLRSAIAEYLRLCAALKKGGRVMACACGPGQQCQPLKPGCWGYGVTQSGETVVMPDDAMQVAAEKWWHGKFITHGPTASEFILGSLAFQAGWEAAIAALRKDLET